MIRFPTACQRRRAVEIVLGQLGQRTTIVAIANAVVLVIGWRVDPARIEALGMLVSVIDTLALAVLQDSPPPPPPPACPAPDSHS